MVITDKDGNEIGRGTTDGNGGFTIETKPFNPGDPITATVTDKAGNKGSDTENASNLTHPNDHTAPSEPTITFVEDINPKDGKLNKAENGSDSDNANTTAKISIPTDAVVNDVIKYTVNGEEKSHPITDADKAKGHIEVKVPVVDGQTSTITAKIVDQAGNASKEVSGSVDVDLTIGNPKVRFLEDTDNNGVLSVAEVAAIKDGKAHWVIDIPTDGSIKAGDVIQSIDGKGNWVKFVTITDEMIKDGRFEATFNVDIEKLRNGKYETPEYRFADDAGNISDSSKATLTLDSELTRQPSNPSIKFPEDTNEDGKISDKENKAGDGDAGKTTAEVIIPQDGSVKPGDKLIVTDDNGKETVRPIEQSDIDKGSIDVPVDLNPSKDNTIIAEIVNPNNPDNPGKGKGVIGENSEATKAPEAPVISDVIDDVEGGKFNQSVKGGLTNDSTPTIKGTAKAGSTVIIYDNGVEIGRIEKADANWEFTTPALTKQGEHKFTAIAKNEFGESGSSNEATIELDTIAPVIKEVTITPIDTAAKADDTAEATLIVGVTDTPHATIIAKDKDGNFLGKADANDKGGFVIDAKPVNPGDKVVFEVTDKAGNTSESEFKAGNLAHPNDHTAPKVNIDTVTPVDETNPSDGTPDKGIVKGKSDEPNAPVVVTDENGKTIGTGTTDDKGNFEITTDPIKPGDKVKVEVTDKAGNKGSDTETAGDTEILHKDLPEAPVINEVIDDAKGYDEDTKVGNVLDVKGHLTNDKTPTIKGTAKAGSKVEIYDNGDRIGETTAKSNGSWEFTAPELTKQGEHKFTATAENKFGKSTPSNEATIDLDSIAPKLDNVKITPIDTNSKADDTAELTMGTGHTDTPNAEILFRDVDNNIIGKGHANSAGDFLIQLDKAVQPGTPVFVQAIDKAGNAGTEMATAGNIEHPNDHTAPKVNIDTVTPVDETNPSDGTPDKGIVKGKSDEPNAPVVVTDENGKTIGTGTTDDKGNFEITTDPIKPGDKVKVEVTDKAGNKGSDTETAGDIEFVDNTPPSVDVKEVTPVDTNNPADGNPDKGIVKGHSDEPNAPVVVKDKDGKIIGTGTTDDKGDFEITTDPIKPGDKVNVEVTDKAGNKGNGEGTAGNTDFTDKTAPDAPVITEVIDDVKGGKFNEDVKGGTTNDSTPIFKGTAEAESTITLKNGNDIIAEKIPVKADGSWEFTPKSPLAEGEYNITATATDKAGNVSNASNVATVTIDLHTSKPVINEIIDNVEGDTGNVKNERIGWTNDNTPTLKGSAEAGATVDVYVDGRKAGSVKANEKGEWEYTTDKLSDGKHSFYAIATDEAGNVSENSGISWIKVDTNPGKVVITSVTDDNGDDALNGAYEGATKDNTPTINGFAEPYSTVTVSVKDSSGKVVWSGEVYVEDSLGDWSITVDKPLNDGDYTVEASMQDYVKNPVQNSNVVSLTVDTATNIPEVKEIVDNVAGGVENGDVKGKVTNDNTPTLKGSAEAGADIKVFVDGKIAGTTKAGFDGSWEFTPRTKLGDGEHKFVVEATDKLGHSAKSIEASVDVDTTIGNPKVRFVEDANNDGVLSVAEVAAIKDGKAHWVIDIPTDGSVKAGDVIQSIDGKGNWVKFVEITDEMIKDGRFEATFNVDINKLKDGKYETPEYRFADDAGNVSDSSKASLSLDSEFSRKPSNPEIKFPEDTNKDGKISDDENKANDKDAGKTTVEVTIPKDGSVKPGDKVVVTDDNGKKTEKPINQDDIDKGKIDIPVDLNPGKDNNVTAEIINPNNPNNPGKDSKVIGEASSTVKVTIDEIIDDVKGYGEDTKVGNVLDVKGHLTNDNLPTFKGSAAPGATVEIYESFYTTTEKTLVGKVTADANGKWSFTPTEAMSDGEHYFEAVATDKVGNKSTSDRVSLDVDTFADAPVIDAVNDNVDSQTGNVLDAKTKVALTNDSTPTLEGYAEPDSVITIYEISELNGDKTAIGTVTADNHGGWKFELPELGDGEYKYTTRAQDKAGNISDFSEEVVVNADLIAPSEPTITFVEDVNPKDGKLNKAENSKDGDSTSTKAQISVPGDAEENDVIHYTVNGEEKTHTITYNDRVTGYVEIKVPVVDGKASSVTAKIVDQAGNASKEVSSSIDSDFTAPNVKITGIIDNVEGGVYKGNVAGTNTNDNKPTIKGTADANQEVILYDNNKEFGRATADKDGNWEFKPSDYKEPLADLVGRVHVIKAVVTDAAGNTSEATSALEVDTTIGAPKVSIKEDADHNGFLSVEEAKNLKDSKIHWEVEIPKDGTVSAGDVLQVLGKDGKWKIEKVLSNDDLGKSFEYEATLSGKHFESPSYRIVDLVGNQSTAIHANIQLDSEFSRKPSNPEIKFPEDTNKDGKISDDENKANDKDAGKTTVEVTIPKDGSVKPGDKVVVTDDNGKKTEKPINQDDIDKGKIDIPVDLNPGKDNNVTAEIINPNNPNNPGKDSKVIGEASSTVKVTIDEIIDDVKGYGEDTKVGNVLDVKGHLTNDNLPTFKGSAAPGATVEIYESFYTTTEKTLVGKVTADANGKWSFTPTEAMSDGEHYFEAVATDKVGNKSTSDRVSLDVDTFADAPVIDAVNDNVDSQTGNVLDAKTKVALTNDSTPTLEGYAEPDSVITIYEISELNGDKTAIGTVTADNHGGWKFELPELGDGEYKYTTRAQDKAGNISDFSEEVVVNADLIAPSEPTITFVEDVNPKDGKLNKAENSKDGDSTSTKAQISVPGDAEENDVIHYTVNGEEKTHTITYNDRVTGYVEIKVPVVDGKASSVTAKIVDQAGNASKEVSNNLDVDIHIDAPVITAVTDNWWGGVENGGNILGVNDGFTNDTTPTFKGKAEAGSTIVLKNANNIIAEDIVVDSDGNWEFTPKSPLAEGEYNVVAIATDKAGNVSVPSNVATVNVDTSTTQPVITEIIDDVAGGVVGNVKNALTNDNLPTLKGTAEAFSTVKIMVDDRMVFKDGKEVTVTADKDGNWEYTFEANLNWGGKVHAALEDGVHTLKVQTTDRAGNRSAVSEWSSVDVDTTIGVPTVKITTDTNSDKKIDINDVSALKDGKLKWVIDIPENTVKAGDRVQILGSDAKTWTDIFKVTAQDIAKGFIERDEFSIDMPKSRGFQTPSYRLVDDAGNVSEGNMDAVKIVGFAPKAPVIKAVLDNEYGSDLIDPIYGTTGNVLVADKALTNDSTPAFMGEAEVGTTITLKKGNTVIAENIPVGSNGKWFYEPEENSPWADGSYEITAIAKNAFDKVSEPSKPITVTVDTTEPYLTIDEINDDVKTSDIDFTGNVKGKVTNDATPTLKGTAEPESLIVIKSGNEVYAEVHAGKNGSWEYKVTTPLSDGLHIFSAQAHDKAGNIGSEIVANVTVDTKIADAKVEFIEDTNNDGKFSWKENIENPNIGRMAWKALISDDGSIKAGDTFNYRWGASDSWHNRTITQADIDRGYIGEKVQNQYEQGQPNAGKPLAFGANANGRVYEAEAYFSDAAGNKGAKGSDKVVFDFSDNTDNKHIATTNVKITSIYDDVRGGHVGNLITNEAAQVAGLTNDKTPTISGTAEANASVKVSVVDGESHSVWEKTITAESDGSWKVTTDNIADGNYSVTAVATNKAGAVSNPYTVSNLEIDTTIAQPNIWIKEDANQDKIYDKADYENPANGNGDITFVVDIPQDRVTIKAGDVFHYMINTNNPKWGNINGYTEDITITEADIKSGSISRVVTLCDDGKDFNMSHNGMIVSMNGYFKDLAGNALSNDTMVRFDLKNTYGGKVRSTRSLPDDILDNDSVDLSNAAHINEPKAELNVLNNNKIGVSANDLLETPKDHIMNEGKSEAKPSYATASSHAGEENIATTHPIQIEEKVESHF